MASERSTQDRLLWLFGRLIVGVLMVSIFLVLWVKVNNPTADVSALVQMIDTQMSIIVGAVLGYAARGSGQPSGQSKDPTPPSSSE